MLTTTLNKILAHDPCGQESNGKTGYSKLLVSLGKTEADDEPLPLITVFDSNGFNDALWCVSTIDSGERKYSERLALSFAEDVRHSLRDPRSIAALDVTRRYIDGNVPRDELIKACDAAQRAAIARDGPKRTFSCAYVADFVAETVAGLREKQVARLRHFFKTGEIV